MTSNIKIINCKYEWTFKDKKLGKENQLGCILNLYIAYPTDPDVTRNGNGVGHWLWGELAKELLVLDTWLWGHWGGPTEIAPGPLLLGQQNKEFLVPFSMAAETIKLKLNNFHRNSLFIFI